MKVFEISHDPDHFQCLLPTDAPPRDIPYDEWWDTLPFYLSGKRRKRGAFYAAKWNYLITSPRAADLLHEHFETAGEARPFTLDGRDFAYLRATRFLDALDHDRAVVRRYSNGVIAEIKRYAFHADRFPPRTSLFRLHEGFPCIYLAEGTGGFASEFREIVKAEELKNLYFREVWNNEQEPEFCGTPWGIADIAYDRWREMAADASV